MDASIKKALEQEKALQCLLRKLKGQITDAVGRQKPSQGVNMLSKSPCCATVKFSVLDRLNLAPSTYIPSAQAAAVKRRLEPKQSVQSILDEVDDMTEKRMVRFSDGEKVALNASTLRALMPFRPAYDRCLDKNKK